MRDGAQDEVPLYKAKLRAHEARLASLQSGSSSSNSNDVIDRTSAGDDHTRRQRLLDDTERLQRSSQRLQDSHRLALETETMGADILQQLKTQRESLTRTQDAVSETNSYIDKASKTLKSMSRSRRGDR
ncbi:snare region anchored in the vesicle membrane C-terminus-domain-containing protein [Zychaea mexicana]|uniref:snare region anchored in the vesicle membrane C-terminus-domain-containing protein n=1 Tax=Zychaea mexicana TaxID=64656 RepID=UPI0022FE5C3B|nr:snare region anchored in the vesicle membrane C-terminus-domain-containing protein [Zychaea mexicana]KAI9498126.1 snare region anchored in the vesicle membrane C-terminus-domain-containing protein [Zychaea mexicana]